MIIPQKNLSSSLYFCSFFIICTVIVYLPSIHNGFFCWDDKTVAMAPIFQHLTFSGVMRTFFSFHVGLYHPLTSISFILDYYSGNGNPISFHLTNLILHLGNIILLFILIKRLIGNIFIAFITCFLFAIHPIHVEAVAWISSRKDLLFSFFFLLSMVFYIDYLGKCQKTIFYFLVFFSLLLSLLSKIQAVSLPFIFLLIDYYKARGFKTNTFVEKIPFFALCLFFGWLNIMAQKEYGYATYGYAFSLAEKLLLMVFSISQYLIKVLIPYPLSVFYPFPFKPGEFPPLITFLAPAFLIFFLFLLLYLRRKEIKPIFFGLLFFIINISIVVLVSFNRDAVFTDRYVYLSSAGILFILAVYSEDFYRKYKRYRLPLVGVLIAYIMILSLQTFQRNLMWRNPEVLFKDALSFYNNSEIILNTLSAQEIESGKYKESISHLNKAIEISPAYSEAFFNRGIAHSKIGNSLEAMNDFSSAIKLNPSYAEAFFARGNVYMKSNNLKNAFNDFTIAVNLDRYHFGAFLNRAIVRGNMQDFNGAISDLDIAIKLNPRVATSYYLRGIALFNAGGNGCTNLNKALSMGYKDAVRAIEYYCK